MTNLVRDHCRAPERVGAPIYGGRYRRLFDDLSPLDVDERRLHQLGRPGGPCDVGVEFSGEERSDFGPCPVFPDLMGFGPVAPDRTVDWTLHIDGPGHAPAQRAIGIIDSDPESLRSLQPDWRPTLPAHRPGTFGLADVLVPVEEA